jgi:cytochrome c oxidase subunit 4
MTASKHASLALAALLGLLGLTIGGAFLPIGAWHVPLALFISGAKASLIVLVFMRFPRTSPLARLAFAAGLFWLGIIAALSFSDYLTRL